MNSRSRIIFIIAIICTGSAYAIMRTDNLGIIIERAAGSVMVIETTGRSSLSRIDGLGDLSHASAVFSDDEHYAYVFGRDGGLTKLDLLNKKISKRIVQAGNSIGGAISEDGKLIAVSNYEPGGVKIFDAQNLELVVDIPAWYGNNGQRSKVVGLVDAPGQRFVFSLFEAGEVWSADISDTNQPVIKKFKEAGKQPYDALITPDGRYYIAGLFGEDGLALLDLENPDKGIRRILDGYGRGEKPLPVYKMPHLEGWAIADDYAFVPAVGQHAVIVIDKHSWQEVKRIKLHGQPVFAMARPDGKQVWVNFALPNNDTLQVIDTSTLEIVKQLKPGKVILHMEFTSQSDEVWVSIRDEDRVNVYNTITFEVLAQLSVNKPSGIFFTSRAYKIGL